MLQPVPQLQRPDGASIAYHVDDFTDPWDKRPLLFLQHGNGRSAAFWYAWIPELARRFRIIRPDARGVGASSPIADPAKQIDIPTCVADLAALIRELNGGAPVHFCGESMGGILGMVLAAEHPELVSTLSLIATPVYISEAMKKRYSMGASSRLAAMREMGIEKWVRATSVNTRFPPQATGLIDWYVAEFSKGNPETLVRYSELVNSASAEQYLSKIQAPTLALFPTNGPITDPEQERLIGEKIANVTVEHLPTEYHMIHLICPEACAQKVGAFCEAHPAA
ncbi:MAG: alpha/beta-hydrolase [Betaproteobacteria bacterium]|nr:alpha/beta-hydrolase [Betaproteobacteria bacterium]